MINQRGVVPGWALYRMNIFYCLSMKERRKLRKEAENIMKANRETFRLALYRRYGRCCVKCHHNKELTIDHILPISKGGESVLKNLQILCKICHAEKGLQVIDYRLNTRSE